MYLYLIWPKEVWAQDGGFSSESQSLFSIANWDKRGGKGLDQKTGKPNPPPPHPLSRKVLLLISSVFQVNTSFQRVPYILDETQGRKRLFGVQLSEERSYLVLSPPSPCCSCKIKKNQGNT